MTIKLDIIPQRDLPTHEAKLLGHEKVIDNIFKFVTSENFITPLSIALHGDWGSGKTSIMLTLQQKLADEGHTPIFFEAWKYEYTNPALALVETIALHFERKNKSGEVAKKILELTAHIISKKFLDMDFEKMEGILRQTHDAANGLSNTLRQIIKDNMGEKKLFVIIDDLDRCDVENALMLLAMMKLFLDVENCIFVAAVDFKRLQHAWYKKYGINPDTQKEGRDYLEKIFQVRIGIPLPEYSLINEFIKTIIPNMPEEILHMMARFGPSNPRGIKRMLNNISYRSLLLNSEHAEISAILWTLLEEILPNDKAVHFHRVIKKNLGGLNFFHNSHGNATGMYNELRRFSNKLAEQTPESPNLNEFTTLVSNLPEKLKISLASIEGDFDVLCSEINETLR